MPGLSEDMVKSAVRGLLGAAPGAQVVLFGSYARGDAGPDSDLDFLVIEPSVDNRLSEIVRLREVLDFLPAAVDIVVVSREQFEYWKDTPNTLYYRASREGRVYDQVA